MTRCYTNCLWKTSPQSSWSDRWTYREKINDKIVKPKSVIDEHSKNLEEIVIPAEKREKILTELRVVL